MSVKCQQVISWIEELAPKNLAADWDNVGLQLGNPQNQISKVLISLDVNEKVAEEAISNGAELIVCHHPYIFKPLKNLRSDLPQGRVLSQLIQGQVALYVAHTNWDCAEQGVNQVLADLFSLEETAVLQVTHTEKLFKIVVYVPKGYEEQVLTALSKNGAGWIGNYSNCSFQVAGKGTFMPQDGANPFIGVRGNVEKVDEYRIETIVPETKLKTAINAMIKAHPYEEVAYDIYSLHNAGKTAGLGVVGSLNHPVSLKQMVEITKQKLAVEAVKVVGDLDKVIKKVSICGGSGSDLISTAAFRGADLLITGDVGYHQAQAAEAAGIALIDAGHYATEVVSMEKMAQLLEKKIKETGKIVKIVVSKIKTEPWHYI